MKSNNIKESVPKSEELAKYAKLKRELELQKIEELEAGETSEHFKNDCNDGVLYDPNDMELILDKWER